jgi:hypothetical protein
MYRGLLSAEDIMSWLFLNLASNRAVQTSLAEELGDCPQRG